MTRVQRTVVSVVASAAAVAVVTIAIALFKPYVPVLSLGVLSVFAVMPVAVLWGLRFALPVSVASMLAFNWFSEKELAWLLTDAPAETIVLKPLAEAS